MEILPVSTLQSFITTLGSMFTANVLIIIGIIALGVAVWFVLDWFEKSADRMSLSDYDKYGNRR